MRNFIKLPYFPITTTALYELLKHPEMLTEEQFLKTYPGAPFGQIDSILCRFPPFHYEQRDDDSGLADVVPENSDEHENCDRHAYQLFPAVRALVMQLMSYVGGERLGRVIINRMPPHSVIDPHPDTPDHALYWERFHIVLQSNDDVVFTCGDERVNMPEGTVWWFNNRLEHDVRNDSDSDRIHIVVDIRTQSTPAGAELL